MKRCLAGLTPRLADDQGSLAENSIGQPIVPQRIASRAGGGAPARGPCLTTNRASALERPEQRQARTASIDGHGRGQVIVHFGHVVSPDQLLRCKEPIKEGNEAGGLCDPKYRERGSAR